MLIRTRSSFERLRVQQYKNCGQLIIYYIDAPPRTAGSALHRAIGRATDAHAYEPFHIPPDGFTKGLGDILAQVESASERPGGEGFGGRKVLKTLFFTEFWRKYNRIWAFNQKGMSR